MGVPFSPLLIVPRAVASKAAFAAAANPYRKEVLRLYVDVARMCRQFNWNNEKGECWGVVLRKNARKEFDEARNIEDPLEIIQRIVNTREAMQDVNEKIICRIFPNGSTC